MSCMRWMVFMILAGVFSWTASAQQTIVVDVNLATVRLTVTDHAGQPVLNLTAADFAISENGEPRDLVHFSRVAQPVAMGVLVDRSISIVPVRKRIDEGVEFLLESAFPADQAFLMTFAGGNDLQVPPTTDRDSLLKTMRKVKLGYGTCFYDAVNSSLRFLAGVNIERKVLVILSDGADHYSSASFNDTLELAKRLGITIHVIGWVGEDPSTWTDAGRTRIRHELDQFAAATGGEVFFPASSAGTLRATRRILDMTRYEYRVSFYASGGFAGNTDIQIQLLTPGDAQLLIRPATVAWTSDLN